MWQSGTVPRGLRAVEANKDGHIEHRCQMEPLVALDGGGGQSKAGVGPHTPTNAVAGHKANHADPNRSETAHSGQAADPDTSAQDAVRAM